MEQVLKSKSRSSKTPPPPPAATPPSSIIVSSSENGGNGSDVDRKRKRKEKEGENSSTAKPSEGETLSPKEPSSGLTQTLNQTGSSSAPVRRNKPPPAGKVYKCKICGREYSTPQALGGHQNMHKIERECEKIRREFYGPAAGRSGSKNPYNYYCPYYPNPNVNPTLPLLGQSERRLYGVPQPLVAPRPPPHIGEWPRAGLGNGYYGGPSSAIDIYTRDFTSGIGSSRSQEEGDAPGDDDNEEDVTEALDLNLKI